MDEKRLAVIRYVSSHYGELQGLTDMAMAVVAGSVGVSMLLFGYQWWFALAGVGVAVGAGTLTSRYYSNRFGRVRAQARTTWPQRWPWAGLIVGATVIWDRRYVSSGLPSLTLLLWTGMALRYVVWNWPFQAHRLLLVGATLLASLMFIVVDSGARAEEWVATSVCLVSIALFVCGWLDHRLLVGALGDGRPDSGEQEAHDSPLR